MNSDSQVPAIGDSVYDVDEFMKGRLLKRLTLVIGIYLIPNRSVTWELGSLSYVNEQQSEVLNYVTKTPAPTFIQTINTSGDLYYYGDTFGYS